MPKLSLSNAEYIARRKTIFERTAGKNVDAFILFDPNNVSYFSRFVFVSTERPMAYILTPDKSIMFVPRMEVEHAEEVGLLDEVISYPEYPGKRPPMETLTRQDRRPRSRWRDLWRRRHWLRTHLWLSRTWLERPAAKRDVGRCRRRDRIHADDQLSRRSRADARGLQVG